MMIKELLLFYVTIKSNVVTVEVPSISQIAQDTTGETVTKIYWLLKMRNELYFDKRDT